MVWSDCQHFSFIFLRIRGIDWFPCALPSAQFVSSLASYIVLYIIYRKDRTCQSKQGKAIWSPFPAAAMRCRLIRPFGPPSPQGEGFDRAVSLALPLAASTHPICLACLPRFFGCAMMRANANPIVCRSPASGGTIHDPCSQCRQHAYYHRRLSG